MKLRKEKFEILKNNYLIVMRVILLTVTALLLLLVFQEQIINLLIKGCFDQLNLSNNLVKILVVILLFLLIIILNKKWNKRTCLNLSSASLIYSLYRFDIIEHSEWSFISYYSFITYTDFIYVFTLYCISYCLCHNRKKNIAKKNNPAEPISAIEDDKFGYYIDAKQLADNILNSKSLYMRSALVVGLKGEWGIGKTSYLNLLETSLKDRKDVVIVRFNPWYSHTYNQLVTDFFKSLNRVFDNDLIIKEITNYSNALISLDTNLWSRIIQIVLPKRELSITELFDNTNKTIEQSKKFIFVLIDDIDRLEEKDISNVLKLIRNIANFGNTAFIVAYDEDYLINTLKNSHYASKKYLEKIFPCPYNLPKISETNRKNVIRDNMTRIMLLNEDDKLYVDKFIQNIDGDISMRNAIRLALNVANNISNLKDESGNITIHIGDYLAITYLSILSSKIYLNIEKTLNTGIFFSDFKIDNLLMYENEAIYKNTKLRIFNLYDRNEKELSNEEYVSQRLTPLTNGENTELILKIINSIFGNKNNGLNRISYVPSFHMYFERKMAKDIITKAEFDKAFSVGSDEFIEKLKKWRTQREPFFLYKLLQNIKLTKIEEWLRVFNDVLSIYPNSISEASRKREAYNIIIPGWQTIQESNDDDLKLSHNIALRKFINSYASDSVLIMNKKFLLLTNPEVKNYISIRNKDDKKENDIVLEYINCYLSLQSNFDDFNEDYWRIVDDYHLFEKLKIRKRLTDHIAKYIDSFIENYPPTRVESSMLFFLFHKYEVTESSASGNDVWLPYFLQFLESISNPSELLVSYINELKANK